MAVQGTPSSNSVHGINEQLAPLAISLDALTPDPRNARDHDGRNVDQIAISLKEHGQRKTIVVQRRGGELIVRAGNGTLRAAKQLGWTHIAAVVCDEEDADAVAYAIRDNRTAELASWDIPYLGEQLKFLQKLDVDIADVGWEPFEYEPLMAAFEDWVPDDGGAGSGENVRLPDRRVALMFTRSEWDELKELLAAKPSADLVLSHLR